MEIKGIRPREHVETLLRAIEGNLDELVHALQEKAMNHFYHHNDGLGMQRADGILEAIDEINRRYGTRYLATIGDIKEYFDKPAIDTPQPSVLAEPRSKKTLEG